MSGNHSSISAQFLDLKSHHTPYEGIDTQTTLKGSAAGKVIFISGASQGIGQATPIAFAQAGAKAIYITARNAKGLEETKLKIAGENSDTQCAYAVCDVTNAEQVKTAVDDCVTKFGGIDVADANAGYLGSFSKIGESDITSWWYLL